MSKFIDDDDDLTISQIRQRLKKLEPRKNTAKHITSGSTTLPSLLIKCNKVMKAIKGNVDTSHNKVMLPKPSNTKATKAKGLTTKISGLIESRIKQKASSKKEASSTHLMARQLMLRIWRQTKD